MNEMESASYEMTARSVEEFLIWEKERGASDNALRRLRGALRAVFDFLPEDKRITQQRLTQWRRGLEERGYAPVTVLNYVKCVNRYLDHVDCSAIRFRQGRAKDLSGQQFGYLTGVAPTQARDRGDVVWQFTCRCGRSVLLPASRVLSGNTLSCGCMKGAALMESQRYYEGTSLTQSLRLQEKSERSSSGYVGVTRKREKWYAYITYKGVRYGLGAYRALEDAVKARARAKELVAEDAQRLLERYKKMEERVLAICPEQNGIK